MLPGAHQSKYEQTQPVTRDHRTVIRGHRQRGGLIQWNGVSHTNLYTSLGRIQVGMN